MLLNHYWKKIGLLLLCVTLVNCGSTPTTNYYSLRADNSIENYTSQTKNDKGIGVGPLVIPSSLENFSVISVEKNNQIIIDSYHLWAGDLKTNISQVIADNLSTALNIDNVWAFPWDNRNRPKQQIRIVIEQFMGERGKEVMLKAKWTLLDDYGKQEVKTEKTVLKQTLKQDDYLSYVQGLNQLLNEFSQTIATALSNTQK